MSGIALPQLDADRSPAIQREQLRSYVLTAPTATVGGLVLGLSVALGFWHLGRQAILAVWGFFLVAALASRPILALAYRAQRARLRDEELPRWVNAFRAYVFAHGVMWGVLPLILFLVDDVSHQFVLMSIV